MIRGLLLVASTNTLAMVGLILFGAWTTIAVRGVPTQVNRIQTTLQSMRGDLKTDKANAERGR